MAGNPLARLAPRIKCETDVDEPKCLKSHCLKATKSEKGVGRKKRFRLFQDLLDRSFDARLQPSSSVSRMEGGLTLRFTRKYNFLWVEPFTALHRVSGIRPVL